MDEKTEDSGAFGFEGTWQEFAPIAFTNLLLTIVTLGIYKFWATTRERRYLWSRTRFIDDRLEWTGTGLELFVGFLLAIVVIFVPLVGLQLLAQGLIFRGQNALAGLLFVLLYFLLFYLVGVAIFRALRYRLSRTYWHGIRGGSNDQGLGYGLQYMWRTIVGFLAFGVMIPWSMTTLWNRRWNQMSFGPMQFNASADWNRIIARWLLIYLLLIVMGVVVAAGIGGMAWMMADSMQSTDEMAGGVMLAVGLVFIAIYIVVPLIFLTFYAAYFREAIGKLELGGLSFAFTARTKDWLLLILGNIGLVIVTLGIGLIFLSYRNWSFFVRHLEAYGDVHLDDLTQSATRMPGQGEGMLDAFDIGAV